MKLGTKVTVQFEGVIISKIPEEGKVQVSCKIGNHSFWAVVPVERVKEIKDEVSTNS